MESLGGCSGPAGCSVCCLKSKIELQGGTAVPLPPQVRCREGLGLALGGQVLKLEAKGRNSRQRIKAHGCQPMRGRKGAASRIYLPEEPRVAASHSETFCFRVGSALERFGNG